VTERLTKRNGVWHFARRVPAEYAGVDRRGVVKLSTKIKVASDRTGIRAGRIADRLNLDLEAAWRAKAGGDPHQAALDVEDARRRARALGLDYKPVEDVAVEAAADLMRRIDELAKGERRHDAATAAAVIGGVALPVIKLSGLFAEYRIAKKTTIAKFSPDQLRKWESAKKRAVDILIEVIGDKAIGELTRDHALKFSDHWEERVTEEGIQVGTANKNITHITGMLRAVSKRHRLRLDPVFAGTRLEGGTSRSRKPFDAGFIVNVILRRSALDGLNDEARAVVHIMVNTGARPAEIINLQPARILLGAEIPHIQVRPDDRVMKTEWSYRDLPLVGISLDAMAAFPNGFARYFDNGGTLSATVNKFFADNGMKPSELHTLYSLRHGFKDRLREVETPEELKDELMGHNTGKPKYGDGHGLRLKLKYIQMIELRSGMPEYAVRPLSIVQGGAARG
jgi:integrase